MSQVNVYRIKCVQTGRSYEVEAVNQDAAIIKLVEHNIYPPFEIKLIERPLPELNELMDINDNRS